MEIWENREATKWLLDAVLEKNLSDPSFLPKQVEEYKKVLKELTVLWEKGTLDTREQLKELSKLLEKGSMGFNLFYRTAFDDRSPQELRDLALEIRKEDTFFSRNDILIHTSLSKIFPELKGYENYVFAHEIDALPSREILSRRKEHFVVVDGTEHYIGTLSDYAKDHPSYLFESEKIEEGIKELKGQIGYRGKVRGTVRVLFRREQVGEIKEGEILVSPMTTPDFLSAMHKAAAFVTDEGGITCHAAIVAREMKKPCVIGTKIATQVLKDGDMVEVDAENGVVRVIEKAG